MKKQELEKIIELVHNIWPNTNSEQLLKNSNFNAGRVIYEFMNYSEKERQSILKGNSYEQSIKLLAYLILKKNDSDLLRDFLRYFASVKKQESSQAMVYTILEILGNEKITDSALRNKIAYLLFILEPNTDLKCVSLFLNDEQILKRTDLLRVIGILTNPLIPNAEIYLKLILNNPKLKNSPHLTEILYDGLTEKGSLDINSLLHLYKDQKISLEKESMIIYFSDAFKRSKDPICLELMAKTLIAMAGNHFMFYSPLFDLLINAKDNFKQIFTSYKILKPSALDINPISTILTEVGKYNFNPQALDLIETIIYNPNCLKLENLPYFIRRISIIESLLILDNIANLFNDYLLHPYDKDIFLLKFNNMVKPLYQTEAIKCLLMKNEIDKLTDALKNIDPNQEISINTRVRHQK